MVVSAHSLACALLPAKHPTFALALYGVAQTLLKQRRFKDALDRIREVLKLQPDNVDALKIAAGAYMQLQEPNMDEAVAHLRRAVDLYAVACARALADGCTHDGLDNTMFTAVATTWTHSSSWHCCTSANRTPHHSWLPSTHTRTRTRRSSAVGDPSLRSCWPTLRRCCTGWATPRRRWLDTSRLWKSWLAQRYEPVVAAAVAVPACV